MVAVDSPAEKNVGELYTALAKKRVPFVITLEGLTLRDEGILADVAPTILQLLGLPQPDAMSGETMLA